MEVEQQEAQEMEHLLELKELTQLLQEHLRLLQLEVVKEAEVLRQKQDNLEVQAVAEDQTLVHLILVQETHLP